MSNEASRSEVIPLRPPVHCECGRVIFDGEVITSRVVRLFPVAAAKCRCKRWVVVPVVYSSSKTIS